MVLAPVLDTVGLKATFWIMNSSVWAVWTAEGNKDVNNLSIS